jgi:hypothetical protein
MGNSLESIDGCCMFTEEKKKYSALGSGRSARILASNRGSYVGSPESRQRDFEYPLEDPQLFLGSDPYSSQQATEYRRDSKNDLPYASYVSYDFDNENDLPYGFVKTIRSGSAALHRISEDSDHYPSHAYNSEPAYYEAEELMETPRMYVSTRPS